MSYLNNESVAFGIINDVDAMEVGELEFFNICDAEYVGENPDTSKIYEVGYDIYGDECEDCSTIWVNAFSKEEAKEIVTDIIEGNYCI